MAGVKISQLPAITSCQGTDLIPEVQPAVGGVTYKATLNQIATFIASSLVTPQDGGIVYTDSTSLQVLAPTATANQMLQSGANSAPHWSTPTYPSISGVSGALLASDGTNIVYSDAAYPVNIGTEGAIVISDGLNWVESTSLWTNLPAAGGKIIRCDGTTNTYSTSSFADTYSASSLLYSSGSNNVTGLATANSSVLVTNSTGVPAWAGSLTNGQLIIGSTGATPVRATITGSGGISVINGAGSITISGSGGGLSWTTVTGTSQALAANNGYVANNAGVVTFTLPASSNVGDTYRIMGLGAGGWAVAQNSGQLIHLGSNVTTTGVGGSLASTNRYDVIEITCLVANTEFSIAHVVGNITVV